MTLNNLLSPKLEPVKPELNSETGKPAYEPPLVLSHSYQKILTHLGPAHGCSPFNGSVVTC